MTCARSLHYQFYSWYAQQLPLLTWKSLLEPRQNAGWKRQAPFFLLQSVTFILCQVIAKCMLQDPAFDCHRILVERIPLYKYLVPNTLDRKFVPNFFRLFLGRWKESVDAGQGSKSIIIWAPCLPVDYTCNVALTFASPSTKPCKKASLYAC